MACEKKGGGVGEERVASLTIQISITIHSLFFQLAELFIDESLSSSSSLYSFARNRS
jgi:hypothetical protein